MNRAIELEHLSFMKFSFLLLHHFRKTLMIVLVILATLMVVFPFREMVYIVTVFFLLISGGLVMSFIIHEYAHIYMMKRKFVGSVTIESNWYRISIVPNFEMQGSKLSAVAAAGPLACLAIAGALSLLYYWTGQYVFGALAAIYAFHLVNLLPFFGDGSMIIKGSIHLLKLKGGEKNDSNS